MTRKLRLGAFLPGGGQHLAAWRHPGSVLDGAVNLAFHQQLAATAERGLFDAYFLADVLSTEVGGREGGAARAVGFEPLTLFSALAVTTKHLGFIATASTSYEEPYHVARRFASLDLISGGRAGWNVVTSHGEQPARNFGFDHQPPHAERYERAAEHLKVVKALWDSWDDDAFPRDRARGIYFDPARSRPIRHHGRFFDVEGPLNTPRPPQGHPVIVQAGQSEAGRDFAAASAEVIFTTQQDLASARAFYADIKGRAEGKGRARSDILIMPGLAPYVGRTEAEARAKYDELNALIRPEDGIALLNTLTGGTLDLADYPLDGPLPPAPETEGMKSRQDLLRRIADEHGFSIRQLYEWVATARGHLTVVGTPVQIADLMQDWLEHEGADGFNILPPWLPGSLDDFVELVIPELQRRGIFRTEYEGCTLRENLGLHRPPNIFAAGTATVDQP